MKTDTQDKIPQLVRRARPWPGASPADPALSAWCAVAQERIDGLDGRLDEFQRDIKEDLAEVKSLVRGSGLMRRAMDHAFAVLKEGDNLRWCIGGFGILALLLAALAGVVHSVTLSSPAGTVGVNAPAPARTLVQPADGPTP